MSDLTDKRRAVFRHANGETYAISRNGGSVNPGYLFKPYGASNDDGRIIGTEEISEVVRALLMEGCPVRCKNLSDNSQSYLRFRDDELISYEIGPEIAQALSIVEKGRISETLFDISRHSVEGAIDAYDRYRATGAHGDIFDAFKEPRDYWVRSTRDRPNRVYPTKPLVGFILKRRELYGGWGQKDAVARLHNAGFIIVDKAGNPIAPPESAPHLLRDADRIRLVARNYFIEPARERGASSVSIRAGDLAQAMGLKDALPNICQALGGEKFQQLARVPAPTHTEPNPSSSTTFTYKLEAQAEAATVTEEPSTPARPVTNLILYGPPGTGKTYHTAVEAVRLCGEQVPHDRAELMTVYQKLQSDGLIEFVTFHQSMSYEEFVEGLRPTTDDDAQGGPTSPEHGTGFRLKPHDGVFKRICEKARLDAGRDGRLRGLDRRRNLFKLSLIGADWQNQLSSALAEERIFWGFGAGVDWTSPEFEEFEAIKQRWRKSDPEKYGGSADISGTWCFRGAVDVGDYVLLSVGKNRFVGLAEVLGDYEYDPGKVPEHSRRVRWIWHDADGAERSAFYPETFNAFQPIYRLAGDRVDWDALETIVLGPTQPGAHQASRHYVLIIDEINRANISKVFGELITLLEADKRLGADNEIRLTLPYSKQLFGVPANLHVIGTMNTADRSIALLDTALRRRFTFREMMPDASVLDEAGRKSGIDLPRLLATINERIEYLYDREHQIGHAYFTACRSRADVEEVMRHKIIPLLAEYFFEDWAKIAAVLGDLEAHEGEITGGFLKRSVLKAPPSLDEGSAAPRYRWTIRSIGEGFDYGRLLGA